MCQRYYETSYPYGTVPGTPRTSSHVISNALPTNPVHAILIHPYRVAKRITPNVTVFSPLTGERDRITAHLNDAGGWDNMVDTAQAIHRSGVSTNTAFGVFVQHNPRYLRYVCHFVADAEL